jgi:superfamily II DNA helicase RecQ
MQDAKTGENVDAYMVSSEQMFPFNGHIPRFATFMEIPKFTKRISYVFIDEAHAISTSGTAENGQPAHRLSYARLGEIRAHLPVGTPVALFSATLPPHILAQCKESIHMKEDNTVSITLLTNRPNIMHAVIQMVGDISNFNNLRFLVPQPYHPPMAPLNKTLIFIDSKLYSGKLANHLLSRFSWEQQTSRPVRHLHSEMSNAHIKDAYESFSDLNGQCRILVATASAANVCHPYHIPILLLNEHRYRVLMFLTLHG